MQTSKLLLGRVLRWISYSVVVGSVALLLWITFAPTTRASGAPGGSVASMGHMGTGIGEAVAILFGGFVLSVVAALLNGMSLTLAQRPIGKGRMVEFGGFLLPLLVVVFMGLSFKMHW